MPRGITTTFSLQAWVDESVTIGENGAYVLAAVIADPTTCDPIRDKLRDLVPPRAGRLHWGHESAVRRTRISQVIAAADLTAIAIVGTPMRGSTQERIRGRCLEFLLLELQRLGVSHVWLESRSEGSNRNDLRVVRDLVGHKMLGQETRVSFLRPANEPMLWLPDAVAGAITAARRGRERWLRILGPVVALTEVKVR